MGSELQLKVFDLHISVVLGTIAGDDTVFIVMRDTNAAAAFCGEIKSLLD